MKAKAIKGRATITDDEVDVLRITVVHPKNRPLVLFLLLWLDLWVIAEGGMLNRILDGKPSDRGAPAVFLLIFLIVWTFYGFWAAYALFWNLAGREVLVLRGSHLLTVGREVGPLRRTKTFLVEEVAAFRYAPLDDGFSTNRPKGCPRGAYGVAEGVIAFDYRGRTYRFGIDLPREEAECLIEAIRSRCKSAIKPVKPLSDWE